MILPIRRSGNLAGFSNAMNPFLMPLSYLKLRSERGWSTFARDALPVLFISVTITVPFLVIKGSLFFAKDGFLDKFSSFAGVLTGFYVAALIAIASVPSGQTDLDGIITKGAVHLHNKATNALKALTRRQYVCLMFGYLSFVSVTVSICSIIFVSLSFGTLGAYRSLIGLGNLDFAKTTELVRGIGVFLCALPISHMALTTVRGLYYLTDKIYVQAPKMMKRHDSGVPDD